MFTIKQDLKPVTLVNNKKRNLIFTIISCVMLSSCSTGVYSLEKCIETNDEFADSFYLSTYNLSSVEESISKIIDSYKWSTMNLNLVEGIKPEQINIISELPGYESINRTTRNTLDIVTKYSSSIEKVVLSTVYHVDDFYFDAEVNMFMKFEDDVNYYALHVLEIDSYDKGEERAYFISDLNKIIPNKVSIYIPRSEGFLYRDEVMYSNVFEKELSEIYLLFADFEINEDSLTQSHESLYNQNLSILNEWKYFLTEHSECIEIPEIKFFFEGFEISDSLDVLYKQQIEKRDSLNWWE